MSDSFTVLVLCTGNSARSVLSEAILNKLGKGRITAYSAGSNPTGTVNPFAVKLLASKGYDTLGFRSKSWDEFSGPDAPALNMVITVCDNAAGETCPIWPGSPLTVHWGFPDPAAATGTDAEILKAFEDVYQSILKTMEHLVSVLDQDLPLAEIKARLNAHTPA